MLLSQGQRQRQAKPSQVSAGIELSWEWIESSVLIDKGDVRMDGWMLMGRKWNKNISQIESSQPNKSHFN